MEDMSILPDVPAMDIDEDSSKGAEGPQFVRLNTSPAPSQSELVRTGV